MAMLSRYQKAGGFLQILQLIETCGKQKQDNFLQMIESENIRWAEAIRVKMLTIEKIISWPDSVLGEVSGRLQKLTLATALHGLKPEDGERLLATYSHSQRRNIDDLFKVKVPPAAEISSAFIKILQEVRSMITNGYLRADKFGPELVIPEDFEEQLGKAVFQAAAAPLKSPAETPSRTASSTHKPVAVAPSAHAQASSNAHDQELHALRTKLQNLTLENSQLKNELNSLREKMAQIKKIA